MLDDEDATRREANPVSGPGGASQLCCRACGAVIARRDDAGGRHVFANPHGRVFEIVKLRAAGGLFFLGEPTTEHSWFPGYAWRIALCARCRRHLGWRFDGEEPFFGLIVAELGER